MTLKILVPKTETSLRPILEDRVSLLIYRDLMTDINNECVARDISTNEFFLCLAEDHFTKKATYTMNYCTDIRPLWQKKLEARRMRIEGNI